jgi:hypothetical protein
MEPLKPGKLKERQLEMESGNIREKSRILKKDLNPNLKSNSPTTDIGSGSDLEELETSRFTSI